MTEDGPGPRDGAAPLVQRDVGRSAGSAWVCAIAGLALAAWLVITITAGPTAAGWLVGAVILGLGLYFGLRPWFAWHGLELRIDDDGVMFGAPTTRSRPPLAGGMARQPYAVAWSSMGDIALVEGPAAATAMRGLLGPQLPTTSNGFFVRAGAPAHLSMFVVDTAATALPRARTLRGGAVTMTSSESAYHPSRRWVFPVRDGDQVVAAIQARGMAVARTTEPALPVATSDWDLPG